MDIERVDRYRLAVSARDDHSLYEGEIKPDMWDYANRTLPTLIASGQIFGVRSRIGQPDFPDLVMPPDGIDFDTAEDLAADTITRAVDRFAPTVLHQWNGYRTNPAVLGTFFINFCSMIFPGPFRAWQRDAHRLQYLGLDADTSLSASNAWDTPESVIYTIEFERHIELIDNPLEQLIVQLDATGITDREIAAVLDLTEKTVEYRLKKTRLAGQARWDREQAADDFRGTSSNVA